MARPKLAHSTEVLKGATDIFWRQGFERTSIGDLIATTGANRFGLYSEFGGKKGLFLAVLDAYVADFVTAAFGRVEQPDAGVAAIADYFRHLIDQVERLGLPGPGCLMANTMTEVAPHDRAVAAKVRKHFDRLRIGFETALRRARSRGEIAATSAPEELGHFFAVSAQGLWAFSRICTSAEELRRYAGTLLAVLPASRVVGGAPVVK